MLVELLKTAGPSALILVVLWLARHLIATRLKSSIQHEFNQKIERLRSQLSERANEISTLQSTMLGVLAKGHDRLTERKLKAAELAWQALLGYRSRSHIVHTFAILNVDGILGELENPRYDEIVNALFVGTDEKFDEVLNKNVDSERLFVSATVWQLLDAYRSVVAHEYLRLGALRAKLNPNTVVKSDELIERVIRCLPWLDQHLRKYGVGALAHVLAPLESKLFLEVRRELGIDDADQDSQLISRLTKASNEMNEARVTQFQPPPELRRDVPPPPSNVIG